MTETMDMEYDTTVESEDDVSTNQQQEHKQKDSTRSLSTKQSVLGYSVATTLLVAVSMLFIPINFGFIAALFLVSFLSGISGFSDLRGAVGTGFVGGIIASVFTGGLSVLTVTPIVTAAVAGVVVAVAGIYGGKILKNKVKERIF